MKKKQIELLQYLIAHPTTMTSKALANALSISVRSVKTYVTEINALAKQKVILSSKQGYHLLTDVAKELLNEQHNDIPQTSDERMLFIIKKLLLKHYAHLDIYALCDKLFVSYSTIKTDIARMNNAFANFHVSFTCENDIVHLHGEEKNKRKLVSYVMFEETEQQFMDTSIITDSFQDIDMQEVTSIIRSTFQSYHYYINDFSFTNLLLHVAIMIDRIRKGNTVTTDKVDFTIESKEEVALVNELCTQLSQYFHIHFNESETFEVYMLFKTNANYSLPSSEEKLTSLVGMDVLNLTKDIVRHIRTLYYIDLDQESFITPFSLHLKNLLLRLQQNTYTKNPMVESIRQSCPTVYDIAVYIAYVLQEHCHKPIPEDEVTFLALHIGAEIERQKMNDTKIQCILLCPDYQDIKTALYNTLLIHFGNQINIIRTISYEDELTSLHNYSLLITTIPLHRMIHRTIVQVPPFVSQLNMSHIQSAIEDVHTNRKKYILRKNFQQFFSPDLFTVDSTIRKRDDIIHLMSDKMERLEYVDASFEANVMKREHAASTAFFHIAIPHAMELEALRTCIGVAISREGIEWNQHHVHVVLLVAINKVDKRIFHDVYEALVMLFSEQEMVDNIREVTDFSAFRELIMQSIMEGDEK